MLISDKFRAGATWYGLVFLSAWSGLSFAEETLPSLVKKVEPAVVQVITYDRKGDLHRQGSGFFVSPAGDIITNRHVLEGAFRGEAKLSDGKICAIRGILAEDRQADLVKVALDRVLRPVPYLRVSAKPPEKAERVVTVGSPLGLEQTVSDGIVSAIRDIPGFGKIMQITAAISPGSSGSPVINMRGEVIGIATFGLAKGQNLNFGVPGARIISIKPLAKELSLVNWAEKQGEKGLVSANDLYFHGLNLVVRGDYEEALPLLEQAIKKSPDLAEVWVLVGECHEHAGRHHEAIDAYKQAIRIKPDADVYQSLALRYLILGRHHEAIDAYKQAIRIKPDDASIYSGLAVINGLLGRHEEAIRAYEEMIRLKPDDFGAYLSVGQSYQKLGRHSEALEAFRQAIRIKPDYADAHYNLGGTYVILKDKGSAVKEYNILKTLDADLANELLKVIYK